MNLTDHHGRTIRKLRISLTDSCNLRCHYCMPVDSVFMNEKQLLTPAEYFDIVSDLCRFGIEEVRLTGGEPLMRRSFAEIVVKLSQLPLKKMALTTNGILLDRHFDVLNEAGVRHLNISLDSLSAATFKSITHGDHLPRILKNIERARELGFRVKINVVAMKGINDSEVKAFVEFSKAMQIEVRFLELMRIGFACGRQKDQFISARELIQNLREDYELLPKLVEKDSTSFNFTTSCGAQIGFIASESQAFCGQCSRWRLSADGILRACLLKDEGLSLRGTSGLERARIYQSVLGMKPPLRPAEVAHQMNTIGG